MTESLCATAWAKERTTERQREWSLRQLVQFWLAVILRAPASLEQALEEARRGAPGLLPPIRGSDEGFFQPCQMPSWRFFAAVFEGFVAWVTPEALVAYRLTVLDT